MKRRVFRRGSLCSGCGERFRSTRAFDRHRIGRGDKRVCRTRVELLDLGWAYNRRLGGWTDEPRQQRFHLDTSGAA